MHLTRGDSRPSSTRGQDRAAGACHLRTGSAASLSRRRSLPWRARRRWRPAVGRGPTGPTADSLQEPDRPVDRPPIPAGRSCWRRGRVTVPRGAMPRSGRRREHERRQTRRLAVSRQGAMETLGQPDRLTGEERSTRASPSRGCVSPRVKIQMGVCPHCVQPPQLRPAPGESRPRSQVCPARPRSAGRRSGSGRVRQRSAPDAQTSHGPQVGATADASDRLGWAQGRAPAGESSRSPTRSRSVNSAVLLTGCVTISRLQRASGPWSSTSRRRRPISQPRGILWDARGPATAAWLPPAPPARRPPAVPRRVTPTKERREDVPASRHGPPRRLCRCPPGDSPRPRRRHCNQGRRRAPSSHRPSTCRPGSARHHYPGSATEVRNVRREDSSGRRCRFCWDGSGIDVTGNRAPTSRGTPPEDSSF